MTLRPDAQAFDEIRIVTVPRFKESELSGDQWRISASVQFYRKGILRHETSYRDVETAAGFLYGDYHRACDDGRAYFGSEGTSCDQEGCVETATVRYRMKHRVCREAHKTHADEHDIRQFCDRHKRRGNWGGDDQDSNYEVIGLAVVK